MKTLLYKLTFDAPAVFRSRDPDPNLERSLSYVPGSAIRGACIERWSGTKDAADPDFRRLFFDGAVRFLHAYPASATERSLPAPRSLYADEGDRQNVVTDLAVSDDIDGIRPGYDQRVAMVGRFVPPRGWSSSPVEVAPRMRTELHMERDRAQGKSTEGQLFNKVAIDAGQEFIGAVECDVDGDLATLEQLLLQGRKLWLGDSRGAEYGANAKVEEVQQQRAAWVEIDTNSANAPDDIDVTVVTLLSDYIGVDCDTGEPSRDALFVDLRAIGVTGEPLILGAADVLSGYLGIARCPRPAAPVWHAGTVLVFPCAAEAKAKVVSLGGRVSEGYGRIAIGWQTMGDGIRFAPAAPTNERPTAEDAKKIAERRIPIFLQWVREQIPAIVATAQPHGLRKWTSAVPSVLGQARAAVAEGDGSSAALKGKLGARNWNNIGELAVQFESGKPIRLKELLDPRTTRTDYLPGVDGDEVAWMVVRDRDAGKHRVVKCLDDQQLFSIATWVADALLDRMRREAVGEEGGE